MSASSNKKMVQDYHVALASAFRESDGEKLDRFLSDDIIYWLPQSVEDFGVSRKQEGKKAMIDLVSRTVPNFYIPKSMKFDFHLLVAEGEWVAVRFTIRAKTVNGKDYENNYQLMYRCEDGRIAECWENYDTAYMRGVLAE